MALVQPFTTLKTVSPSSIPLALLVQQLDSIFDLYADETRDFDAPVFRNKGFLPILKAAVGPLKALVRYRAKTP